jgi:polyphenol oxidase
MRLAGNDENNLHNREGFFSKAGIKSGNVVSALLSHSVSVKKISDNNIQIIPEVDALVTPEKNIYLSVTAADCIPVFFYEPQSKIIGIAHAGWRGIVGGIIINTFNEIKKLGGMARDLQIAMGPGINACHFDIKPENIEKYHDYPEYVIRKNDKIFVDLKGIIEKQLMDCGVKKENIENNNDCTFANKKYFSYRRDKPKNIEAMMAVIGIK